jgi:hypothetical protein
MIEHFEPVHRLAGQDVLFVAVMPVVREAG